MPRDVFFTLLLFVQVLHYAWNGSWQKLERKKMGKTNPARAKTFSARSMNCVVQTGPGKNQHPPVKDVVPGEKGGLMLLIGIVAVENEFQIVG